MVETEEAWARVFAALEGDSERLTPGRKKAIRAYAASERLCARVATESDLVRHLKEVLPAIGATLHWAYGRRGVRPPVQAAFSTPLAAMSHVERLQSRLVSESMARIALEKLGVAEFRNEFLAGRKLRPEDARGFLSSFAVQTLSPQRVRQEGLSLVGCTSARVRPMEGHHLVTLPDHEVVLVIRLGVRIWSRGGQSVAKDLILNVPAWPHSEPQWERAEWKPRDEQPVTFDYLRGSVFEKLWRLADHVAWSTFWSQTEATWFILTGQSPPQVTGDVVMNRHIGSLGCQGRIMLTMPPWVSHGTVGAAYRRARAWMLGGRPRAMSLIALKRYEWVLERFGPNPTTSELSEAARQWGRTGRIKRGRRATAVRNFARDFSRTRDALLTPLYAMGKKRSDLLREQIWRRRLSRSQGGRERRALIRKIARARKSRTRV